MALTAKDREFIAELVAAAVAAAPTKPSAASAARPFPFAPVHPCTAKPPCGRMLRTPERAAKHGHDGHTAAKK